MLFELIFCIKPMQSSHLVTDRERIYNIVINTDQLLTEDFVDYKYNVNLNNMLKKHLELNEKLKIDILNTNIVRAYTILVNIYMELLSQSATVDKERKLLEYIDNFYFNSKDTNMKEICLKFVYLCDIKGITNDCKQITVVKLAIELFVAVTRQTFSKSIKLALIRCVNKTKKLKYKVKFKLKETTGSIKPKDSAKYNMSIIPYQDPENQKHATTIDKQVFGIYDLKDLFRSHLAQNNILHIESHVAIAFMSKISSNGLNKLGAFKFCNSDIIEETIIKEAQSFVKKMFIQGYREERSDKECIKTDLDETTFIFIDYVCDYELILFKYLLDYSIVDEAIVRSAMSLTISILELIKFLSFYAMYDMIMTDDTGFAFYIISITCCDCKKFKEIIANIDSSLTGDDFGLVAKNYIDHILQMRTTKPKDSSFKMKNSLDEKKECLHIVTMNRINIF